MQNRSETHWRESRGGRRVAPSVEGLSQEVVFAFCDAIEFGIHADEPTSGEVETLRSVLRRIAREARQSRLTPERMLIGLKSVWTKICHREPAPDLHDPTWDLIVRESLVAYEHTG